MTIGERGKLNFFRRLWLSGSTGIGSWIAEPAGVIYGLLGRMIDGRKGDYYYAEHLTEKEQEYMFAFEYTYIRSIGGQQIGSDYWEFEHCLNLNYVCVCSMMFEDLFDFLVHSEAYVGAGKSFEYYFQVMLANNLG